MMRARLLSPREGGFWAVAFVLVAALIVLTQFSSTDPDSQLYASISGRLSEEPVSHWIAPEWWDFWPETHMTGLFREHPAGVFLVPVALSRLGIPGEQAAYIAGVGAGLASLLLIAVLIGRLASVADGRASLILLQLMPVAFLFRVRANHEYPMLVALLVTLVSVEGARRSWWWIAGIAFGLTLGLLVKGVFVVTGRAGGRPVDSAQSDAAARHRVARDRRVRGGRRDHGGRSRCSTTSPTFARPVRRSGRPTGRGSSGPSPSRRRSTTRRRWPDISGSTSRGCCGFRRRGASRSWPARGTCCASGRGDQQPSSWARLSPTSKRGLIFALGFTALAIAAAQSVQPLRGALRVLGGVHDRRRGRRRRAGGCGRGSVER